MNKTKTKKSKTPSVGFKKGLNEYLFSVGGWCKSRTGRSGELAVALGVPPYAIHDWFVSQRFDPPAWAVFAVQKILILPEVNPK